MVETAHVGKPVERRLREELAKLRLEVNEEKTRILDVAEGGSFGFLGFEFRRVRTRAGRWMHNPWGEVCRSA